ncbi:MAG: 6-bladed beta-propeller [Bacteroidota bacterium]|nr:6-bladed beta-propeller [Bacteroidota bacterium]
MHHNYSHAARAIGLGLSILCLAPYPVSASQVQESSFTLREELVIGDDEDAPAEYLFYYPQIVRTDSDGNIYVNDARRADVRVFDASGQYLITIGRRGKGARRNAGDRRDACGCGR